MVDLTLIEGGGGTGPESDRAILARQALRELLVELLRALANGDPHAIRVTPAWFHFWDRAVASERPLSEIIGRVVFECHEQAISPYDEQGFPEPGERAIIQAALRTLAESLATDPAAKGRRSQRSRSLHDATKESALEHERKAREHGWSYVQNLVERLGPWPPKSTAKVKAKPRSSRRRPVPEA